MTIDLTGGLDPARDFYLTERPEDPDCRESANVWVSDDQGRFGFPRVCVEAMSKSWDTHGLEVNLAFPDGRAFVGHGPAPSLPPIAADGLSRIFAAGPLKFETIEPFKHLRVSYDGEMSETTVADQAREKPLGRKARVRFEIDCEMAVPPWEPGTMTEDARKRMAGGEAAAVGGARYEQLFRARGRCLVAGEPELTFTGTGLRIHRVGVRNTIGMRGHCWQSAVFPSGKAFGYIIHSSGYNEGFVFENGKMIGGKVIEAPWLTEFKPNGWNGRLVLETNDGRKVPIEFTTIDAVCTAQGTSMFGAWPHNGLARLFYHQGGALYRWDGEEAYGMIERSLPKENVKLLLDDVRELATARA